jgi:hypothetical protein
MRLLALFCLATTTTALLDFNCTSPPLRVSFGDLKIGCGTELVKTNAALKHAPSITLANVEDSAFYTIMMIVSRQCMMVQL